MTQLILANSLGGVSYLPLIFFSFNPKGCSITHMHGLAVYVKEALPFAQELFLEN